MPKNHFYRLFPLLLLIFIDSFSYFVVIPVLLQLFFHHRFGLLSIHTPQSTRDILTGVTISLSPLATLLSAPLVGDASDKYGRKKTLTICIFAVIIGFLLPIIGIAQKNIFLILGGRFVAGIGSASQSIAQAAVSDLCQREEKALYLSFIALMMTLALVIAPLAGGYLSHWFTLSAPYWLALGLSLMNLILLLFFFTETKAQNQTANIFNLRNTLTELLIEIKQCHVGQLIVLFFCLELGWSQYYQSISLFLQSSLHFHTEVISVFNASMGLTMSAGLLILYPVLLRIFSIKTILYGSLFFVTIGLIACVFASNIKTQWLFSSLVAIFTGCGYVSLVALISEKTPVKHQGLMMGYLSTMLYLAWMTTSIMSGYFFAWYAILPLIMAASFLIVGSLITQFTSA